MPDYNQIQAVLRERLDQREHSLEKLSLNELRSFANRYLTEWFKADISSGTGAEWAAVVNQVVQETIGLGVLEQFLADPDVSEIMVNNHSCIYVEKAGKLERTNAKFSSESALYKVIERIVVPLGRRIDTASPMVDARLADGSRVNAVIPPLALAGACLTIRKFHNEKLSLADLESSGSLSRVGRFILELAVQNRLNLVISGGTGTGKTTLLNALALEVSGSERIVTVEDAAELRLHHPNCVALEARPANQEGTGEVSIRALVRNALRMRPDRIIVGECRGVEAIDMLQAMNTGHAGSFTTVHANSARDALRRLEVMVLMAGIELPLAAVRQQVVSALDLVIQITRKPSGRRVIECVHEVVSMDGEVIQMVELLRWQDGRLRYAGVLPKFYENLSTDDQQQLLKQVSAA
ncbi:pilus assembly protein CpaF [Pseudidiomarina planktonica]|uniref:Pilus assembly protein CpaF n=1 Tax=Pseudidiomarina planktonica TaxID=1323738 RepID=A0A1Y6EP26_9GAMM|nr:CpaF family protein [Pseudidiomarina planktonica]RUO65613.1 CpaF family protein [Pseudidiomarina planktonica]SMQ64106.1 pilus assembly protein CpaF [Pseudidiomarina planktonica]